MSDPPWDQFLQLFPHFQNSPALSNEICATAEFKTASRGVPTETEGECCAEFVFVLSGEKRIYKRGPSGREVTLYEVGAGDICVLNALCILSDSRLPAHADSLSELNLLTLPATRFRRIMQEHESMRAFVFARINQGFAEIMSLVSEIVFNKMDQRLISYLKERSESGILHATHQRIADALGTSREVVSRLLKDFERRDLVRLSRNRIELTGLRP